MRNCWGLRNCQIGITEQAAQLAMSGLPASQTIQNIYCVEQYQRVVYVRHAATRHTIAEAMLKLVDQGADGCTENVFAI